MAKVGTSNVNVQEIGSILNAAGGSVDINQPATFFSADANLNKWSKYKPVIHPNNFIDDDSRWKGADLKCGLTITNYTYGDLALAYTTNDGQWVYTIPNGSTSQPRRLGDFRGYSTSAVPFIVSNVSKGEVFKVNNVNNNATSITIEFTKSTDANSLKIEDFSSSGYLVDAEVCALVYTRDPVVAAENGVFPIYEYLCRGSVIKNTDKPSITIDTTNYAQREFWILLCIGFSTNQFHFMTLPHSTDAHYHLVKLVVTKDSAIGQTFGFAKIGTTRVSLTDMSNYSSSNETANYFDMPSRGRVMFQIEVVCDSIFTIYDSRTFDVSFTTDEGVTFNYPNMVVYQIDGASATSGSLAVGNHTISLRTESDSAYLVPPVAPYATKGVWTFELREAKISDANLLASYPMYVNPVN